MKPIQILFFIAILLVPHGALATFPDVPTTHQYFDAIHYLQDNGIASGYPDGSYKPEQELNRAEFLKITLNAWATMNPNKSYSIGACSTPESMQHFFSSGIKQISDVPVDSWFAKFVCEAKGLSIIEGYPDETFRPSDNINFVEAAKIVTKTFSIETTDSDIWYKQYVDALAERGVIPQTISSFDQLISRGEMAEMIFGLQSEVPRSQTTYESLAGDPVESSEPTETPMIEFAGAKYSEGLSYPHESDECLMYTYKLADQNEHGLVTCRRQCKSLNGVTEAEIKSLNKLDENGSGYIYAYQCTCNMCE